jgi:3'-phosphoadenosine 5'-phosphosulfate sulfotransferase (PAPS reductase)/FAD synthetase
MARTCELAADQGVLDRVVAIHADMGRMEHAGSLELVTSQADYYGIPLMVVRREQGDLLEQAIDKGIWPRVGMSNCQGTSDHKRGPIWTAYTKLVNLVLGNTRGVPAHQVEVLEVIGLARHEGGVNGSRDKKLSPLTEIAQGGRLEINTSCTAKRITRATVTTYYPIADLSKQDVWDRLAAETLRGCPGISDTYERLPRFSCSFCVFASRDAINVSAQLYPDLFAEYVQAEQAIGEWKKEWSLADVAADIDAGRLVDVATDWDPNQA